MASLLQIAAALRGQDAASVSPQVSVQLNASLSRACSKALSVPLAPKQSEATQPEVEKGNHETKDAVGALETQVSGIEIIVEGNTPASISCASSASSSSFRPGASFFRSSQPRNEGATEEEAEREIFPVALAEAFAQKLTRLLEGREASSESGTQRQAWSERRTAENGLAAATVAFLDLAATRLGAVAPAFSASLTRRAYEVAAACGLEIDAKSKREVCPFCGCMRIPLLTASAFLSRPLRNKRRANRALRREFLRQLAAGGGVSSPTLAGRENSFSARDLRRLAATADPAFHSGEAKRDMLSAGPLSTPASNVHTFAANRFLKNELVFLCFLCARTSPPSPGCISTPAVYRQQKPSFLGSSLLHEPKRASLSSKLVSASEFNKRKRRRAATEEKTHPSSSDPPSRPSPDLPTPTPQHPDPAATAHLLPLSSPSQRPSVHSRPLSSLPSSFPSHASALSLASRASAARPASEQGRTSGGKRRRTQFRTLEDAVRASWQKPAAGFLPLRPPRGPSGGDASTKPSHSDGLARPREGSASALSDEARRKDSKQKNRYFALVPGETARHGGDAGRPSVGETQEKRSMEARGRPGATQAEKRDETRGWQRGDTGRPLDAERPPEKKPDPEQGVKTAVATGDGVAQGGEGGTKQNLQSAPASEAGKTETASSSLYDILQLAGVDTL
ncbi:conserved hypothetical protein [Neospora caninum Liverpool]|uniref:RNAse P Rpr2/Rpp21 subunit domain-containing protein n=1 Tax=Neospora caninum (strain Liverpool) TaxID=572307 RepID=F0VNZ3_NEOCL|nr:conserved hypothetical protein [Neospora caninum Liverpool]CBZ55439.1 conserved hypothetical protein [Neospora caninum Liverpool]CEL70175.1 TPA: RNAse P Rpr2/Rpp21 subunit domain-containing protein [Neospora caninum Liverpool]|eukprot:XP_003885467.1 conserved hypothetical protein [Neospora caninum Liverpool]